MQILPFESRFAPMFDALNRAWIEEFFWIEPIDNAVLGDPESHIIAHGGELWFAVEDDQVLGCCALIPQPDGLYEFTKLGVAESARGRGIARALLRHCYGRAKALGTARLRIFTSTKLGPANALYRSEGFIEIPMSDAQKARYQRADIMYERPLD